ncbi:MAG: dTMP kinase, partial [Nitrosotalea sp.]
MTTSVKTKIASHHNDSSMKTEPRGKLIIVEGIDGSGKSTQIHLLEKWLAYKGVSVFRSEWNSSE